MNILGPLHQTLTNIIQSRRPPVDKKQKKGDILEVASSRMRQFTNFSKRPKARRVSFRVSFNGLLCPDVKSRR